MPKLTEYTTIAPLPADKVKPLLTESRENLGDFEWGLMLALYDTFSCLGAPENLDADGENTPAQTAKAYQFYYKRRDYLFKGLGGSLDEADVLKWGEENADETGAAD